MCCAERNRTTLPSHGRAAQTGASICASNWSFFPSRRRKGTEIFPHRRASSQRTERNFLPQRRRDAEKLLENAISAFSASLRLCGSNPHRIWFRWKSLRQKGHQGVHWQAGVSTANERSASLRRRLRGVVASLVIFWSWAITAAPVAKPNIIFILADDLGYGEVGCYGQEQIKTPYLDQMAREGIRFTSCYAGCTVCAPSRCTLMTGLHTGHARIRGNGTVPL